MDWLYPLSGFVVGAIMGLTGKLLGTTLRYPYEVRNAEASVL